MGGSTTGVMLATCPGDKPGASHKGEPFVCLFNSIVLQFANIESKLENMGSLHEEIVKCKDGIKLEQNLTKLFGDHEFAYNCLIIYTCTKYEY